MALGKHGAGLQGEVVDGKVGRCQGNGLPQLAAPVAQVLTRQTLDQIQAPAAEGPAAQGLGQPAGGLQQVRAAVAATQPGEHGIVKALAAQAHPVYPGLQIASQAILVKTGWIKLQADLSSRSQAKPAAQSRQQGLQLGRRQQRRRAATEINRGKRWAGGRGGNLLQQQAEVGRNRGRPRRRRFAAGTVAQGHHRKVAIKATPVTKGDVQIGTARRPGQGGCRAWSWGWDWNWMGKLSSHNDRCGNPFRPKAPKSGMLQPRSAG